MPKYQTITYNNKELYYFKDSQYIWFPADEWLPLLHLKDPQKTLQKIPNQLKKRYTKPTKQEILFKPTPATKRTKLTTIRHDKFFNMVKWNKKEATQHFKAWFIKELPNMLTAPKQEDPAKLKNPTTGKPTKNMFNHQYGKLTLYYAEREEWLQDIDAIPSDKATNWLPGQKIKTTSIKDCHLILKIIKMGYLAPEQFIYIEYYPQTPLQLIYSYNQTGEVEKFTKINQLICSE